MKETELCDKLQEALELSNEVLTNALCRDAEMQDLLQRILNAESPRDIIDVIRPHCLSHGIDPDKMKPQ